MKLSKHAKFWALGALGGVGLFALGVFAQQNGALDIDSTNQDLFSDLKAVFFLERKEDNNEINSIVRLNVSNGTVVSAPTSDLAGGEAKNTLQNNASIIGSTNSVNTSSGAFLIATNSGRMEGESMQSFVWGASNTTLNGYNAIAVATKNTKLEADNTLALAAKDSTVLARDSVVLGGERITINPAGEASLAVWSKINVLGASGALVFNGKTIPLQVDTASAHTMVVNADNGLIINTNNSNNQKIQLTVSGAIKLWEVNNAPAQASPYISVKTKGSVTCVCGKVNNQNSALSKYTRGNKQIADLCQKVCDDQNTTLTAQCGAAATNYPLTQTQWSTDDFCQWGLGHAGAKPTFPTLGGQVSWTCESFPSGGPTCTATRKGCGDGIRAAGEQCDLGTNNGKPDSNCSVSCENVKAPKCWANAKTYLGSDVAWAQPNGFCTDDSVLEEATPAFWNGSTSGQKTWTCKNKNNKNLTCSANRLPPAVAGACGTTLNTCSAGTLSGQTTIPHGDRWSCDGLYGGSNKTCSRCDSGYKYNTTTNICEIDCPNPIYRHTNGVTIKAAACAEAGREYMFEGQKYYVARDKDDIKAKIAANAYPANRIVTTRVTEFNQLFYDNHTFNQDIWNWDTSNVTNMYGMFYWAKAFNQPLNNWNISKVTDMKYMFYWAETFNQPLNNRRINQISDENLKDIFGNATAFKENQPYCNWANWSAKKWNFVNMGLNACINGQCKAYPWNHASQPATSTTNGCIAGDYQDIADDTNSWKWKCIGKYSGTSTECSASKQPTCPSGFTANNGKCVQWACQTRIKPWTHWCKNVITKDAQSLCTTITDQASCDDSYEVSIGYPWGDPNYQNLYPNAYRNIVLGPNLVSKDFAENKIVPYTPWGINMGYIWWTNGTSMFGYGKIGPCEWGEKEQIVSCKDLLNSILPETDCNLIPKPGKGQICTSPITPEPPQTPNPKHTPTCTEPDRTSFYSEGEVIRVADWSFSDETIKNDLRYYLNKFYIDNRGYTGKPYLYIPVTYPGTSSPTSVQGQVTLELQLKNSGVPDYYTYESGTYQFETQKGYLGPDTNYVRIQLKKSLPCSSSTCSFKIKNLTATLPPLTVPCPSTCPSGFSKYNGKCIQWKCIATTERKLSWECRDDGWNYVSTHDCESANASYDKSCPPKSGSTIPRPPVPPKKPPVPPLNGQCKTYAWSHTSQPATSKVTGCLAGDYEDIPDDTTNWKWKCTGKNGGTSAECSTIKWWVNGKCSKQESWKCLVGNPTSFQHHYISNASGKLKCANGGTANDHSYDTWNCVWSGWGEVANCRYTIEDPCEGVKWVEQPQN